MHKVEVPVDAPLHAGLCEGGRQNEDDDVGEGGCVTQEGTGQRAIATKGRIADHDPAALMNRRLEVQEIARQDAVRVRRDIEGDRAFGRQVPAERATPAEGSMKRSSARISIWRQSCPMHRRAVASGV